MQQFVYVLIGKEHEGKSCINEFQNVTHVPEMELCSNVLREVTVSRYQPRITTLLNRNELQRTWKVTMCFLGSKE